MLFRSRYSGVVTVGPDGRAEVSFPLPAFNGTARVMVTAWSAARVGAAAADVVIRDPVVASGTLPRFLDEDAMADAVARCMKGDRP